MSTKAERDMQDRYRPDAAQITIAVAMLDVEHGMVDAVVVPLVLPGKQRGVWTVGQPVEPVYAFWPVEVHARTGPFTLAAARDDADRTAALHLYGPGMTAYVIIQGPATWSVFEGIFGVVSA